MTPCKKILLQCILILILTLLIVIFKRISYAPFTVVSNVVYLIKNLTHF